MQPDQVLAACRDADVRLARFLYCDNSGLIRGKASAMPGLSSRLQDGVGLTVAMMAMNCQDQLSPVEGMGPVGEIRLVPDLETFSVLPYAPGSAAFSCDMLTGDGTPWAACPRTFLKRMRERSAGRGLHLRAAFEAEFSLNEALPQGGYAPIERAVCFSSTAMHVAAAFVRELVEALEAQGLTVEQYYPEAAKGQHEISIRHTEALTAADNQIKLRETIRSVAWNHGYFASLAPKPRPDDVGSGAHIHFSLWNEGGRNVFFDETLPFSLSETGRRFMAGVLHHLPALCAVVSPSVNSYQRLAPCTWSGSWIAYGLDNREVALRVASPFWSDRAGSVNLELKTADASCNPYLALGALLAAGLDGIERGLDPGTPVDVDPATLTEAERGRRGIRGLPTSLDQAVAALEADEVLTGAMGPLLATSFLTMRKSEADLFRDNTPDEVAAAHFYLY